MILFDFLLTALVMVLIGLLSALAGAAIYRSGLCCGMKVQSGEAPEELPAILQAKAKPAPMSPEQRREQQLLENIDRYDGTGIGQQEIVQ